MPKFRKKPVVIEAEQFNSVRLPLPFTTQSVCCLGLDGWYVNTLEGPLKISEDDWIVKGIKDEFYPVKPDIFAATYESVD